MEQENRTHGKSSIKVWLDEHPWTAILGALALLSLFLGVVKYFAPQKQVGYSVQSANGNVSASPNTSGRSPASVNGQNSGGGHYSGNFQPGNAAGNFPQGQPQGAPPIQGPVMKNTKYQLKGAFVRPSK